MMTTIVTKRAAPMVRGELTRWLLEVDTGVFVGDLDARRRDLLWQRLCAKEADCLMVCHQRTSRQAMQIWTTGAFEKSLDFQSGMWLRKIARLPKKG